VDLGGYAIDITVISETHLKLKHADNFFDIASFQLFQRDRSRRQWGGVAVYVQSELEAFELTFKGDNAAFELLWVKVRFGARDVVVGALYHPLSPTYKMKALLDYIEASLDDIAVRLADAFIVLAGDMNSLSEKISWPELSSPQSLINRLEVRMHSIASTRLSPATKVQR
jgi:exonuclease III